MSSLFLEAVDIPSDRSAADRAVLAPHRMERQPDGESLAYAGARERDGVEPMKDYARDYGSFWNLARMHVVFVFGVFAFVVHTLYGLRFGWRLSVGNNIRGCFSPARQLTSVSSRAGVPGLSISALAAASAAATRSFLPNQPIVAVGQCRG